MKIDPRLEPMFRSQPAPLQFLAMAFCALLQKADMLDEVIGEFAAKDVNWSEKIAGKPLFHWQGKTREKLAREGLSPKQIDEVEQAFKARGLKMAATPVVDAPPAPPALVPAPTLPNPPTVDPKSDSSKQPEGGKPPEQEPQFAGRPLSSFEGMERAEIIKVEGISPKVADKIVAMLAEKAGAAK